MGLQKGEEADSQEVKPEAKIEMKNISIEKKIKDNSKEKKSRNLFVFCLEDKRKRLKT